jgi:cytochrome c556
MSLLAALTLLAIAQPPQATAQSLQLETVMRQKLTASQQLLAALVTSNWAALDRHTRALQSLTNQPGWDVMRLPEFHAHTTAFQRSIQALTDAARQRDQRVALAAYNGLVSSCVECHVYVARARIAGAKGGRE